VGLAAAHGSRVLREQVVVVDGQKSGAGNHHGSRQKIALSGGR